MMETSRSGSARPAILILAGGVAVIVAALLFRSRAPASPTPASRSEKAKTTAPSSDAPIATATRVDPITIRGQVLDGKTGKPVAGAEVFFHRPRCPRPGERFEQSLQAWYRVGERGSTSLGAGYKHDDPDHGYDRPEPGVDPVAQTESDESGAFELNLPMPRGILECRHAGYMVAFRPYFHEYKESKVLIHLFSGVLVRGRVLRPDGEPVREKLKIALFGKNKAGWSAGGVWPSETDEFGAFEIEVAAPAVLPKIQVLGWRTISPDRPVDVVEGLSIDVVARRVPLLHVFDSVTREPIEHFSVLLGPPGSPGNYLRGEFDAPDGIMALLYDTIDDNSYRGPFKIQVWAKDRAEFEREVPDLLTSEDIEAALRPGEAPAVTGLVRRKGAPVVGAAVSLNSGNGMSDWKPEKLASVVSGVTGPEGDFKLLGPAGPYILIVRDGSVIHAVPVRLPTGALVIELGDLADVHVRVHDLQGKPLSDIVVLLQSGESARRWKESSDGAGLARFSGIAPGDLWVAPGKVYYPGVNEYTNNVAPWIKFQAPPGQTTTTDLVISEVGPPRPLPTKLAIRGVTDFEGWKIINNSAYARGDALAIDANGAFSVPSREAGISIVSPWGDRWSLVPPKDVGDSWNAELDPQGPGYDGLLLDQASGQALSEIDVSASSNGFAVWHMTTKTDADGRFRIRGLGPGSCQLYFTKEGAYGISFEPSIPPAVTPPLLRIAIPKSGERLALEGIPNRTVSGRVLDSTTSQATSNTSITVLAMLRLPQGHLIASLRSSGATVDGEGRFTVTVPTAARYRAHIFANSGRPDFKFYEREWAPTEAGDLTVEFRVP